MTKDKLKRQKVHNWTQPRKSKQRKTKQK